jgi:hypothetical protein
MAFRHEMALVPACPRGAEGRRRTLKDGGLLPTAPVMMAFAQPDPPLPPPAQGWIQAARRDDYLVPNRSGQLLGEYPILMRLPHRIRRRQSLHQMAERDQPALGGRNHQPPELAEVAVPGLFVAIALPTAEVGLVGGATSSVLVGN